MYNIQCEKEYRAKLNIFHEHKKIEFIYQINVAVIRHRLYKNKQNKLRNNKIRKHNRKHITTNMTRMYITSLSFLYKERKFQEFLSPKRKKEKSIKANHLKPNNRRKGPFEHNIISKYKIQW